VAVTVTYDHPDFPDGYEFYIQGLGLTPNRESVEVSEEQERAFYYFQRVPLMEALDNTEHVNISGTPVVTDFSATDVEISDTPPADPTIMNIDPETNEVFAEANLTGAVTEPDFTPVEVPDEAPPDNSVTVTTPGNATVSNGGGD
jgi:hypothetical protein